MTTDTATTVPTPDELRERVTVVLDAMLMGAYGRRVREIAQTEVGRAITDTARRRPADPPAVLTAIIEALRFHLHSVHVGEVAVQVVNHLMGVEPEVSFREVPRV